MWSLEVCEWWNDCVIYVGYRNGPCAYVGYEKQGVVMFYENQEVVMKKKCV